MLRLLAFVGLLFCSLTANALHIYIAFDTEGDADNRSLLNTVENHIKRNFPEATTSTIISSQSIPPDHSDKIIISLGSKSLQQLLMSPPDIPIVALFISRASFFELSQNYPDNNSVTAVFSDPSIIKQLALIRVLYGDKTTVGYFVSDNDPYAREVIEFSNKIGLSINKLEYKDPSLRRDRLKKIDVLLLQNNKALFKYLSLDDLLYITYDLNNTGIIGYSSGLVKKGAVATTYHTLDDILRTLTTSLVYFSKTGGLFLPTYPETYQLASNKYVIRSLGISKPSDEQIIDYINQHDQQGNGL